MSTFLDALNEFSYASSTRGENYYLKGKVLKVDFSNYECRSVIKGSDDNVYETKLKFNKKYELISNSCSCPVGYYCKHIAATLYALDEMANNNELEMNEERLEGPKSDWRRELDKIFLKYFASRYRFSPSYSALTTFLNDSRALYRNEQLDTFAYITKRLFEYVSAYYYDVEAVLTFLNRSYNNYLKKDEFKELLNLLKKDDFKRYIFILSKLVALKDYSKEANEALGELLIDKTLKNYKDLDINTNPNKLSTSNLMVIANDYPKWITYYQARDAYALAKKNKTADNDNRRYAFMLYFLNTSHDLDISDEDYEYFKEIDKERYQRLIFLKFIRYFDANDFVSLLECFEDYKLNEEYDTYLRKYKNKYFYLSIYYSEPVSFEEVDLGSIVVLLNIPNFFSGYERAIINLANKKINHAKKLKNYDDDIEHGLVILNHFHDSGIVPLLMDKVIMEKMEEYRSRVYLYLLYQYELLEALGYQKYGILN